MKTIKSLFSNVCRLFPRLTHLSTEYYSRRIVRYLLNNHFHLQMIHFRLNENLHVPNHN